MSGVSLKVRLASTLGCSLKSDHHPRTDVVQSLLGISRQFFLPRHIHLRHRAFQAATVPISRISPSAAEGNHENFTPTASIGRPSRHFYLRAKAFDGYQGTYDQWKLENPNHTRPSGDTPYISSLKHTAHTTGNDFIRWVLRDIVGRKGSTPVFQAGRHVLVDGGDYGLVQLAFVPSKGKEEPKEIWLRPYFDPASRSLKFQTRDGDDYPHSKPLDVLARGSCLRPLLHLAHHQGLLDFVPPSGLPSLHFEQVRKSGFTVHGHLLQYKKTSSRRVCRPGMRILLDGRTSSERLVFTPVVSSGQEDLSFFPYIGDSGLLQLWDVSSDSPISLYHSQGRTKLGWPAGEVSRRWPKLFELAQSEGFWADS